MEFVYSKVPVGAISLNIAETTSSEPTLVMLHGVTRKWQTFLPIVAPLALRHRLLMVDFRGHGLSDRATDGYLVANYIDDVCELICKHVDGPVFLYGHSLGAMTAAGVAAKLHDTVAAIVMEDPPLHAMGQRISDTSMLNYFTAVSAFAGSTDSVASIAKDLGDAQFLDPVKSLRHRIGATRDGAQLRFAASCLQKLDPNVFGPMLNGNWLEGFDVDKVFSNLKCPALLLQADVAAGGMLTNDDADHVLALNADLVRVRFEGVAHGMHWTATPRLLNTVLPFLESVR
ncbi:MAG: alpha/beta hydrolase [Fuerstiella sp.]|mgnify:FL=1